ncbi:hypothetical protein TCE0_047f18000 [Talaromyces pinophilus]|uniref:Scytalone dehydratase-like domain-containing protein n=1 Tax=Talaromyces pinophilus TaxID=128442 RepID=A0A0B8MYP7_TALPI|nr:hypothetical protein TCE0_047f18000 [Talaromyces pinophilus]
MASVSADVAHILKEITFEWGECYDTKDWARLRAILAENLSIDYSDVTGEKWADIGKDEFVSMVSDEGFVGDPLVDTQHFIGASKFERLSDIEIRKRSKRKDMGTQ